ncbi:hypothetical protein [Spiroplasma endosymbiont of Eupeodes luniger]|uniref:hypothetical protein n=1 Tax=Spiroplasma endosymbiont of Eupeodes luniger TaxID=3066300 RepID=UPI0030CACE77
MDLLGAWGIIGFIAMILLGIELVFVAIWSLDRLLVKRKKAVKATSIEEQDNTIEEVKVEEVELDEIAVPTTSSARRTTRNKVIIC